MARNYVIGSPGGVIVTDDLGTIAYLPGVALLEKVDVQSEVFMALVENDDQVFAATRYIPPQTLSPDRHVDDETVRTAAIAHISPVLLALVVDDDSIPAAAATQVWGFQPAFYNPNDDAAFSPTVTTGSITVSAPLVTSPEIFYTTFVTLVGLGGGPLQKLKPPPKHTDNDVIYAFTSSRMSGLVTDLDVIRAPIVWAYATVQMALVDAPDVIAAPEIFTANTLRPALVPSDDASYDALFSMVLQPALFASDDEIPAADVGWKVFAEITTDVDEIYSVDAYAFYPLYPDVWMDEEHVDTYPFFVQSLEGGVPVPPREGVLKGSIKKSPQLKGSITSRRAA